MNIKFIQDMFDSILGKGQQTLANNADIKPSPSAVVDLLHKLQQTDNEVSHINLAQQILDGYQCMTDEQKVDFFNALATQFPADSGPIEVAINQYMETRQYAELGELHRTCEPPQQELLRRINMAPGRTYDIVNMRADHLRLMKKEDTFKPINADFMHLFSSWFNRGFLILHRIDWNTPAAILEKIIAYEAVHQIKDWNDLRRRLDARDRRCFAFFHPATGDEPLIFVEVALTQGIPDSITGILSGEQMPTADTAAFYGISNCQAGLRGVSFGNFLIKQVVQELKQELPELKNFVTTSPAPGFSQWVNEQFAEFTPENEDAEKLLKAVHALQGNQWIENTQLTEEISLDVKRLAALYLVHEKRGQGPANAVARFHLGNGATLHRINWPGDLTMQGLKEWHGLMINYLYEIDAIEHNHEVFMSQHKIVTSEEVDTLASVHQVI